MAGASVLIVGMKGLGVEIAKNVVLAGVKSVDILDLESVELRDLSSNFYLSEADVGRPRAACCLHKLTQLNSYVAVRVVDEALSEDLLIRKRYQVVVLTEQPLTMQMRINTFCHDNAMKFISGDVRGVLAACFVDLGDAHVVSDLDGERKLRGLITHVSNAPAGVVTVLEEHRHGLSDGDYVTFEEVEGMVQLNQSPPRPVRVLTPYSFTIEDTTAYSEYTGSKGYFEQVKMPRTFSHQTMAATFRQPSVLDDPLREKWPLHCLYHAMSTFQEEHGRLPRPYSKEDAGRLEDLAQATARALGMEVAKWDLLEVARCCSASISAMAAFLGGVMGQEVLKACSGKFAPLTQYLYFEAKSCLPSGDDWEVYRPQGCRYDDQIAVFGGDVHQKLCRNSYFLVGAGAIGCEMIKNLALMGVSSGGGLIHVTDMDTIEKSNLNRQFLFREADVKCLKAEVAAREAKQMNPALRVQHKALRVGAASEPVYNEDFWNSLDGVITALDNVEARLYLDQRCVYFQKPMLDSGTLGTKGNTQVVVPFLTESYGASRDPPEESIPICTLKNFPSQIEHTIQWAAEAFEGQFHQSALDVNSYLDNPSYLEELARNPNNQLLRLQTIHEFMVVHRPNSFGDCVRWARLRFDSWFNAGILQLLQAFPRDHVTKEGLPFWSGAKRAPTPLQFDVNDELCMDFVLASASLHAQTYHIKADRRPERIRQELDGFVVPPPKALDARVAATEEEAKKLAEAVPEDYQEKVARLLSEIPAASPAQPRLFPIVFEKDDPTNFHIDFIAACSNLRARNYNIKEVSKHETKFVSGKIIPAIATTTALVAGLVCLEMFKLVQNKGVAAYRNTYVNLALPLVTLSDPNPPRYSVVPLPKGEWKWSLWDRLDVGLLGGRQRTLGQLLEHLQETLGLTCSSISYGPSMLYYDFGTGLLPKVKARLPKLVSEVAEEVGKLVLDPAEKYIALEAAVQNEDMEDVEIPYVRFRVR